jgi:hypothetical protein
MADKFKFALAVLLLVAGVAGFYLLAEQAMILRVLAVLAGAALAAAAAWQTEQGRRFFDFAREASDRSEKGGLAFTKRNRTDNGPGFRLRCGDGRISLVDRQEP